MMYSENEKKLMNDSRFYDFFRVAAVSLKNNIANPEANIAEHIEKFTIAAEKGAQWILAPELSISSYSSGNLFFNETLLTQSENALFKIMENSPKDILCSVGMPLHVQGNIFNTVVTYTNNKILLVTPKINLPNSREFYEKKEFAAAENIIADSVQIGSQKAPFGIDYILNPIFYNGVEIYIDICEDLWVPIPYSRYAALAGATILGNASASNITIGKNEFREMLVVSQSGTCLSAQLYTSSICESSSDLSWDGQIIIAECGKILAKNKLFERDGSVVVTDINVGAILADRMHQNSFRDNERMNRKKFKYIEIPGLLGHDIDKVGPNHKILYPIEKNPFVPNDPKKLVERCEQVFNIQEDALIQRLESLPDNLRKIHLGLSGGRDSTYALLIAISAFNKLNLDLEKSIYCYTMPGYGTTENTKHAAFQLARIFNLNIREISIHDLCEVTFNSIGFDLETEGETIAFENIQAWSRTHILFSVAADIGGLVLGTGDLSESALGFCTYKGDHMSHYAINQGVAKTLIEHLINYCILYKYSDKVGVVLQNILDIPISPELKSAKDGEIQQITEDIIGPYKLHDFFLYYFVRYGFSPVKIARLCYEVYKNEYEYKAILHYLKEFITRFFDNQFKRNCNVDGPKVGLVSLSPRGDWRMPSDAQKQIWIDEINDLEEFLDFK